VSGDQRGERFDSDGAKWCGMLRGMITRLWRHIRQLRALDVSPQDIGALLA